MDGSFAIGSAIIMDTIPCKNVAIGSLTFHVRNGETVYVIRAVMFLHLFWSLLSNEFLYIRKIRSFMQKAYMRFFFFSIY